VAPSLAGDAAVAPFIEPTTQEWLEKIAAAGARPVHDLSPEQARAALRAVQASVAVDMPVVAVDDRVVAGGPSGEVVVRILRPSYAGDPLPIVLHLHGGGWMLGDSTTHERLARELANRANVLVVFVEYTPAPEAHYPVQNEQAYAALEWAIANAAKLGADRDRVGLVGDSSGGNMAAALTLMSKQRGGPKIGAQVLLYPATDANLDTASYDRYADGPWLTRDAMHYFWDAYLPDHRRRSEITASPLQATLEQLHGLPPALVINAEHDVLRDEGEAYGRRLSQAGVPVTQVRYGGTIHDFVLLNPLAETPAPRAAIAQVADFLRFRLVA
jgi:acetyl esterase